MARRMNVKEMMTRGTVTSMEQKDGSDRSVLKFWELLGAQGKFPYKINTQEQGGQDEVRNFCEIPRIYKYSQKLLCMNYEKIVDIWIP